jgi:Holliday junction resolvase
MPKLRHVAHGPPRALLSPPALQFPMGLQTKLSRTIRDWAFFLEDKGYLVARPMLPGAAVPFDLLSVHRQGQIRLWKVAHTPREDKRFTQPELKGVRRLIELAHRHGADPYLVIRFGQPAPKVLTVPAELVLAENPIRANLGGIAWPPQ